MKANLKLFLLSLALFLGFTAGFAQNNERQRPNREQLAEKQAAYIANQMAFDDATKTKFVETFCNCQKEIWALGPRVKNAKKKSEMTEADVEAANKARFEHSQKLLDIRKNYYEKYSKFLTQKQIARVYELEKKMMNRLGNKGKQQGKQQGKKQDKQQGKQTEKKNS